MASVILGRAPEAHVHGGGPLPSPTEDSLNPEAGPQPTHLPQASLGLKSSHYLPELSLKTATEAEILHTVGLQGGFLGHRIRFHNAGDKCCISLVLLKL